MKIIRFIQMISLILCINASIIHADGEHLSENNKTAYTLAKNVANNYVHNYRYEKGASVNACSMNGKTICRILSNLVERTRLFSKPMRDDLKILSRDVSTAFRNFDFSGSAADQKIFVQSLTNLLQAVLPLLEGRDAAECRLLIQEVSKTML